MPFARFSSYYSISVEFSAHHFMCKPNYLHSKEILKNITFKCNRKNGVCDRKIREQIIDLIFILKTLINDCHSKDLPRWNRTFRKTNHIILNIKNIFFNKY